jgi:hypothetical protein
MANQELYKQAIADAKQLKEISMAQAKQAIAEAFNPRIQEMFRLKLSELEEDTDDMKEMLNPADMKDVEEGKMKNHALKEEYGPVMIDGREVNIDSLEVAGVDPEDSDFADAHFYSGNFIDGTPLTDDQLDTLGGEYGQLLYDMAYDSSHEAISKGGELKGNMDEMTLDEILAELEESEHDEDAIYHASDVNNILEAKEEETEEAEEETEEAEEETEEAEEETEEAEESNEVAELSVEEFKDLIRDVIADVMSSNSQEGDLESGDDEVIGLDEILAELEGYGHEREQDINYGVEDTKHHSSNLPKDIIGALNDDDVAFKVGDGVEVNVDAANNLGIDPNTTYKITGFKKFGKGMLTSYDAHLDNGKTVSINYLRLVNPELEEANDTINHLKETLSEVNLLNAKLLYVNKIFKSKSLTESQKVKVINAFDRAENKKEAQNIYETLKESLLVSNRNTIKESVGFASKPLGNAPAKPIVEADNYVSRMQILAGIKKTN